VQREFAAVVGGDDDAQIVAFHADSFSLRVNRE
jgi:hypothetical protein